MRRGTFLIGMGIVGVAMMFLAGSYAQENSGVEQQVKERIRKMSDLYNAGEFKEAFDLVVTGANGYIVKGGLMRLDDQESKEGVVEYLTQMRKDGWKQSSKMQNLEVHAGETGAVATYISDETLTSPQGEEKHSQVRSTEVWIKADGEWMLFHWHFSEMQPEEDGQ